DVFYFGKTPRANKFFAGWCYLKRSGDMIESDHFKKFIDPVGFICNKSKLIEGRTPLPAIYGQRCTFKFQHTPVLQLLKKHCLAFLAIRISRKSLLEKNFQRTLNPFRISDRRVSNIPDFRHRSALKF